MEALVGDDSRNDHDIGYQDEATEYGAHTLHQYELGGAPVIFGLIAVVVEEAHELAMVALVLTGHLAHSTGCKQRKRQRQREIMSIFVFNKKITITSGSFFFFSSVVHSLCLSEVT